MLTVRGATFQILATCPVVKIVFMAGSPDYSVKLGRGMRALWSIAPTTLVGVPCLVVERSDGSFEFPRANAINVRTMEF